MVAEPHLWPALYWEPLEELLFIATATETGAMYAIIITVDIMAAAIPTTVSATAIGPNVTYQHGSITLAQDHGQEPGIVIATPNTAPSIQERAITGPIVARCASAAKSFKSVSRIIQSIATRYGTGVIKPAQKYFQRPQRAPGAKIPSPQF